MGNQVLDNKQFFETDYQEAGSHKTWLDSLIVTLTHGTEIKPAEGFDQAVVEFEDPAMARARVAVALGLIPVDVALDQEILEPAENGRRVDSLALRMRQRLYPELQNAASLTLSLRNSALPRKSGDKSVDCEACW